MVKIYDVRNRCYIMRTCASNSDYVIADDLAIKSKWKPSWIRIKT
jgi:hypothetical protein